MAQPSNRKPNTERLAIRQIVALFRAEHDFYPGELAAWRERRWSHDSF